MTKAMCVFKRLKINILYRYLPFRGIRGRDSIFLWCLWRKWWSGKDGWGVYVFPIPEGADGKGCNQPETQSNTGYKSGRAFRNIP